MEKQRLTYLLQQHLADAATVQEQQELSELLQADTNRELFNTVLADMMQQQSPALPANMDRWHNMVQDIIQLDKTSGQPVKSRGKVVGLYKWAAAAAVLLLVSSGVYYLINRSQRSSLAVTEKTKPEYKVVSTARGRNYEVVLPDGSHVWLNAASSIRFPAAFSGNERLVELSGEAFFDVKHADKMPFRIRSGSITTSVLGTAFDINAYPGQKTMIVAVQRGRVQVQAGTTLLATLQKGQQVKVASDTTALQNSIDTLAIAGWRQGNLYYKDEELADIIADLQRVFNEPIQIKRASLNEITTTVSFNKDIGIQKALEIICRITDSRLSKNHGIFIIE